MNYQMLFKELTYAGVKVFIYCMTHKEGRDYSGLGRWLGLKYNNAISTWDRGIKELEDKGYMKEGKWQKKAVEVLQKMEKND